MAWRSALTRDATVWSSPVWKPFSPNPELDPGSGLVLQVAQVEKDRGLQNPGGFVEGYGRVGVRVWISQP
jgi:hypothetical protein